MTGDGAEAFRAALDEALAGLSAPERRATFVGLLEDHLPEDTEVVLVGGALVELLTEGMYVTGDIDLVGDPQAVGRLLEATGFAREGRLFVEEDLGLAVEIVGRRLDPERRSERIRYRGRTLHVLSIEDLIVDRLCAAKFWESQTDHEQAQLLYGTHHDRLDMERLRARAKEERVEDLLDGLEPS